MIMEFIKSEYFILGTAAIMLVLAILVIISFVKLSKVNKEYNKFMKKLGNGENIDEMLKKYIGKVENVENENKEIEKYCERLEKEISTCTKKIGMVRYSAFQDTGSDLSFALALLDGNNNGVVLNGIYSREMSNIYAKQIVKGKALNKLSDEEEQALDIAMKQIKAYKTKE